MLIAQYSNFIIFSPIFLLNGLYILTPFFINKKSFFFKKNEVNYFTPINQNMRIFLLNFLNLFVFYFFFFLTTNVSVFFSNNVSFSKNLQFILFSLIFLIIVLASVFKNTDVSWELIYCSTSFIFLSLNLFVFNNIYLFFLFVEVLSNFIFFSIMAGSLNLTKNFNFFKNNFFLFFQVFLNGLTAIFFLIFINYILYSGNNFFFKNTFLVSDYILYKIFFFIICFKIGFSVFIPLKEFIYSELSLLNSFLYSIFYLIITLNFFFVIFHVYSLNCNFMFIYFVILSSIFYMFKGLLFFKNINIFLQYSSVINVVNLTFILL
jgi:hypothetical protein